MKKLLFLFALVSLMACSKTETNTVDQLYGTWKEVKPHSGPVIVNGVIDTVTNAYTIYKFTSDNKYEVEQEILLGVPANNGTWTFDETSNVVTLNPNSHDEEVGIERTYKLEIISITDQTLEVTFKYRGEPSIEGDDPIIINIYRKFEKQ